MNEENEATTQQDIAKMIDEAMYGETEESEKEVLPETTPEDEGADAVEPEAETEGADAEVVEPEKATAPEQVEPEVMTNDNAVVLAKDGKHTIPFEKLAKAREGEVHWRDQYNAVAAELAKLRELSAQNAQVGENSGQYEANIETAEKLIDEGVDLELFGDFSEEAIAKGIASLVDQRVAKAIAPTQAREAESIEQQHFNAIEQAHPDIESIVESSEFDSWVAKQPSFSRDAIQSVLSQGTATQVIELFDTYKAAITKPDTGNPASEKAPSEPKKTAKAQPEEKVPNSLSDLPSSSPSQFGKDERVGNMSAAQQIEEMSGWSPQQIEDYVNRNT